MSMKKMLAVVAAASLVAVAAPALAANPFSDVPMNHWAYDAVAELSAKGILEGYPDNTFRGNRAMTRYEIATMVARMMNAELDGSDLEMLKALIVEFQPELEALGVKVDSFDSRLAALEKGVGGWKISGQMRFDYKSYDYDDATSKSSENSGNASTGFQMNRARLFLHRDLADGLSFDARWHSDKFDRFFMTARDFMGVQGLTLTGGAFPLCWEDDDGLFTDYDTWFMDVTYRGFDVKYQSGMFLAEAFAASNKNVGSTGVYDANEGGDYYGARLKLNFNEKFWLSLNANWNSVDTGVDDGNATYEIGDEYALYWVAAGFNFSDGIALKGMYEFADITSIEGTTEVEDDDPKAWKVILDVDQSVLKFTNLWVEYAQFDKGHVFENLPWGWDSSASLSRFGLNNRLQDDMDMIAVRLRQTWNPKVYTEERFVRYDMDGVSVDGEGATHENGDATEWSIAVGYQYNPALLFELGYAYQDGKVNNSSSDYENKLIRFRTLFNF